MSERLQNLLSDDRKSTDAAFRRNGSNDDSYLASPFGQLSTASAQDDTVALKPSGPRERRLSSSDSDNDNFEDCYSDPEEIRNSSCCSVDTRSESDKSAIEKSKISKPVEQKETPSNEQRQLNPFSAQEHQTPIRESAERKLVSDVGNEQSQGSVPNFEQLGCFGVSSTSNSNEVKAEQGTNVCSQAIECARFGPLSDFSTATAVSRQRVGNAERKQKAKKSRIKILSKGSYKISKPFALHTNMVIPFDARSQSVSDLLLQDSNLPKEHSSTEILTGMTQPENEFASQVSQDQEPKPQDNDMPCGQGMNNAQTFERKAGESPLLRNVNQQSNILKPQLRINAEITMQPYSTSEQQTKGMGRNDSESAVIPQLNTSSSFGPSNDPSTASHVSHQLANKINDDGTRQPKVPPIPLPRTKLLQKSQSTPVSQQASKLQFNDYGQPIVDPLPKVTSPANESFLKGNTHYMTQQQESLPIQVPYDQTQLLNNTEALQRERNAKGHITQAERSDTYHGHEHQKAKNAIETEKIQLRNAPPPLTSSVKNTDPTVLHCNNNPENGSAGSDNEITMAEATNRSSQEPAVPMDIDQEQECAYPRLSDIVESNVAGSKDPDVLKRTESSDHMQPNMQPADPRVVVYVAAPKGVNFLNIIGEDPNLGQWKSCTGQFIIYSKIEDVSIFKGFVRAPYRLNSPFKFVMGKTKDQLEYEGKDENDNRNNELLPGSVNFFALRLRKSYVAKFMSLFMGDKSKKRIAYEFIRIANMNVLAEQLDQWDLWFESLQDALEKIKQELADNKLVNDAYEKFFEEQRKVTNYRDLITILTALYILDIHPKNVKKLFDKNFDNQSFIAYLLDIAKKVKRNQEHFRRFLERFATLNDCFSIVTTLQNESYELSGSSNDITSNLVNFLNNRQKEEPTDDMLRQVIGFLVKQTNDMNQLWQQLKPFIAANDCRRCEIDKIFLDALQPAVDDDTQKLLDFLKSDLLRSIAERERSAGNRSTNLHNFFKIALNLQFEQLLPIVVQLPAYLTKFIEPIIEDYLLPKLRKPLEEKTYNLLGRMNIDLFNNYQELRYLIEVKLLEVTDKHLRQYSFHLVPSVRLIIASLARRDDVKYLDEPSLAQLNRVLTEQPSEFFRGLDLSLHLDGRTREQTLAAQRSGKVNIAFCNRIQQHYDYIDEIVEDVRVCSIPLKEAKCIQNGVVRDCLLRAGLGEIEISKFNENLEAIRQCSGIYSSLYSNLAQIDLAPLETLDRDDAIDGSNETFVVFYLHEWNKYLTATSEEKSPISVAEALKEVPPLRIKYAKWLANVIKSRLFFNVIWIPLVRKSKPDNLSAENLEHFVKSAAQEWYDFAKCFNDGKAHFKQIELAIKYDQNNFTQLVTCHELINPEEEFCSILQNFDNFHIVSRIRHLMGPFVVALRSFALSKNASVDGVQEFVQTQVVNNWNYLTVEKLTQSGIIRTLNNELALDKHPENIATMEFLASLVTSDSNSPLIDWLRQKSEQDFEAMGKILQDHLFEAYGQLQTLMTRIAPYLNREFDTHHELLAAVHESEKRFSKLHSGHVQDVKLKWLSDLLPEIDTAIKASTISPSEEAKEKLGNLSSVLLESDSEHCSITVRLTENGKLSVEELKQTFQLLDMATSSDEAGELTSVTCIRRNVELIVRFAQMYESLFNSGFLAYHSVWQKMDIKIVYLQCRLNEMRAKLNEWNNFWQNIKNLSHLALFSRGFLLYLAKEINQGNIETVVGLMGTALSLAPPSMNSQVSALVHQTRNTRTRQQNQSSDGDLLRLLTSLNDILAEAMDVEKPTLQIPSTLKNLKTSLETQFASGPIQMLNIERASLVGTSLAAYVCLTSQQVEPSRILFMTACTSVEEVERFMRLWSIGKPNDLFAIVHVERFSTAMSMIVGSAVARIPSENWSRLLLLAQKHRNIQSTKSLGVRLGIMPDRSLKINIDSDTLRKSFTQLSLIKGNVRFYTSEYPGCGKSQLAMRHSLDLKLPYRRIVVREGTVEEVMYKLRRVDAKTATFLHLDVGHSVSLEFNDILLSFILHGALYDPRKPHLGYWKLASCVTIGVEFASPLGAADFPIINFFGTNYECKCNAASFSYELARMSIRTHGQVSLGASQKLIVAAKFLDIKNRGEDGLVDWDEMCRCSAQVTEHLPPATAFRLLVHTFSGNENQNLPTFTSLMALASFIYRHVLAMVRSPWLNSSAENFFQLRSLTNRFKLDVFELLSKVANHSLARCWSLTKEYHRNDTEFDWERRQKAMLLLGVDANGEATSFNIVGRSLPDMRNMFHASLHAHLQNQSMQFQELNGVRKLLETEKGTETVLNALRSLLYLDGSPSCLTKARQLDNYPKGTPAIDRLNDLFGHQDLGYVLTGDNLTKMMFALYRVRCGLPVIVLGETGVGKSALFRFLVQSLCGHNFSVLNVNSGTTIEDVISRVREAMQLAANENRVFLFFDEINTADSSVIALFKELMLDHHLEGERLPENLHMIAAANPYRLLKKQDHDASVGLSFRFGDSKNRVKQDKDLVYRVNQLPRAFYDHLYDFGTLSQEAENIYIEELCQYALDARKTVNYPATTLKQVTEVIQKSHVALRTMSDDSKSAVSLRDAARALQLFAWFESTAAGRLLTGQSTSDKWEVSLRLSIYVAYAFRFTDKREDFLRRVFGNNNGVTESVKQASRKITHLLNEDAKATSIGSGTVALNDALCENLLGLFVCVLNGIFVIIVGRPGTSKSLSVEILKLLLSRSNHELRRELGDLPALVERYFQCSPLSTSASFKALFSSAEKISADGKTTMAMVVLDELGLADLSPERPIKVLHSELERRAVLTSGELAEPTYSVVALSNWVIDAAQVNRGILIRRKQADHKDLLDSAKQLATSLVKKIMSEGNTENSIKWLNVNLTYIVDIYEELDSIVDIGGRHFFSMRDFFFCVKHYVCSVLKDAQSGNVSSFDNQLIVSVFRNFGGHDKAIQKLIDCLQRCAGIKKNAIETQPVVERIVENIEDSCRPYSVHIARHLMILNRSLIGLQLLNRHVKTRLDQGTGWNVLFGSCFPEDLHVTSVTRKLRQVEQAIRRGGVLVLCHADQLFESLYMVLNQQYWAQGDVKMTQIALGPSVRAIALPDGPLRIIALQDTDIALNRRLMSPAVLSRFEKHELRPRDLLDASGRELLTRLEAHPIWSAICKVQWRKLIFGYHEDLLASLALHLQTIQVEISDPKSNPNSDTSLRNYTMANIIIMYASNAIAMIKFEKAGAGVVTESIGPFYRKGFIFENLVDALNKIKYQRIIVMTNSQRHVDVFSQTSSVKKFFAIQLFDVRSELEFDGMLSSLDEEKLVDEDFCLLIQYDATEGPIEQFQFAKYEIEAKLKNAKCRVVFVVHIDPISANNRWIFSFGDGWEYIFIDELHGHNCVSLKLLTQTPNKDQSIIELIHPMTTEQFKGLLLEMLGPALQISLQNLGSHVGPFFKGIRTALSLSQSGRLVDLLKECLLSQLEECKVVWNVLDAVNDQHFDSSTSLTQGLWEVFKQKLIKPLAHLLLITDVWRVADSEDLDLWCRFLEDNFRDRLVVNNSTTAIVEVPAGMQCCRKPFGRLLAQLDKSFVQHAASERTALLRWLFEYINQLPNEQDYFCDWLSLRLTPSLRPLVSMLPLGKMRRITRTLFSNPVQFAEEWFASENKIICALEFVGILSSASKDDRAVASALEALRQINNWKVFVDSLMLQVFQVLQNPNMLRDRATFLRIVTSLEVSPAVEEIITESNSLPEQWIKLRITKQMYVFDQECDSRLYEFDNATPDSIIECLSNFVIDSVLRTQLPSSASANQRDLRELLITTASFQTLKDFTDAARLCPTTQSLLFMNHAQIEDDQRCPKCNESLDQHLMQPNHTAIEQLFQKHQKFMLLLQQITEIFVEAKRDSEHEMRDLFRRLFSPNCTLRMSWRFFSVIARRIMANQNGCDLIDRLLTNIPTNGTSSGLQFNAVNFLKALLACADEDVKNNRDLEPQQANWSEAMLIGDWSISRVHRLAELRRALVDGGMDATQLALAEWAEHVRNEADSRILDAFLFFVFRFASNEGDELHLRAVFNHPQTPQLNRNEIIWQFKEKLAPMNLGFTLQPVDGKANRFQSSARNGELITQVFPNYNCLHELEPDWSPYIARLAAHASDIARQKRIEFLMTLTDTPGMAANLYLPGIENHQFYDSYMRGQGRWYVCDCGTPCMVGDCGNVVMESVCGGCRRSLAAGFHQMRPGVRLATNEDFAPPRGIHMTRLPSTAPAFAVRNLAPSVTRLALLLNCLCLLDAAITSTLNENVVRQLVTTLPVSERINRGNQRDDATTFLQILCQHVLVNLEFLCKLVVTNPLTRTNQFRTGHIILHQLLESKDASLTNQTTRGFSTSVSAREAFETALGRFISRLPDLARELKRLDDEGEIAIRDFNEAMKRNESEYWIYSRRTLSSRGSVQIALERNPLLKQELLFLNMLLDDAWAMKLEALTHLANGARFIALVRTSLQGQLTKREADRMSIGDGISKIVELLENDPIIIGQGQLIKTENQVRDLFKDFRRLWKKFSSITNEENKTFLEYFECEAIPEASRPGVELKEDAPLVLILAGTNCPEMTFSCQLLANAIEAANSIAQRDFIKPHCRSGTKRTRFNCSSATGMASFDETLYAHAKRRDVDSFIADHAIDDNTMKLAEYYAMVTILGPVGNTVAENIVLDPFPEFAFKETAESANFLADLERNFSAWQPTPLENQTQDLILADLERNRLLVEAKSVLISVLTHVISCTEPLVINQERKIRVDSVIQDLLDQGILTNEHVSRNTQEAFIQHVELQVHQAMGLLKSIMRRMRGDDIFGGRIPPGWDEMLTERLIRETTETLREQADKNIATTLNTIAGVIQRAVSSSEPVPHYYNPDQSLLQAIRDYNLEENWNGIPSELKLANLGHVLLLAEQVALRQ